MPNPSTSSSASVASSVEQLSVNSSINGISSTSSKPQVFDYGHQSNSSFLRQNSHPGNSGKNYHNYKKSSPLPTFSKVSPRLKASPSSVDLSSSMDHSFSNATNNHSQNGPGNQPFNNHRDLSQSTWNQKRASSSNHQGGRKPYTKQTSHKY